MGDVDQAFKRLFLLRVGALLKWLIGGIEDVEPVLPDLATERQLVTDTLYRVTYHGIRCLVNIEIQFRPEADLPRRLWIYAARADHLYDLPVISVVIYVFKQGKVPTSPYERRAADWQSGTWNFHSIKLYELSPKALFDAGLPGILPLVPLTKKATRQDAEAAMQQLKQEPPDEAEALGALLAIFYAHAKKNKQQARELFRRHFMANIDTFIQENPILHDVWEQVMAQGESKGKAEGEAHGMRAVIQRVLESRFGPLGQDTLAALNTADAPALLALSSVVGTESLAQVRARLGL